MKRSTNSSSAPKPDPPANKSPSKEDDKTTSGSRQKPEPDAEVVPKDTDRDPFSETKTQLNKPPKTEAERTAFIAERNRMRRFNGPAARSNYSVMSSSARHREVLESAKKHVPVITVSDDSSVEDEDQLDEEEEMAGEGKMEEEDDLKLGKQVVAVDDSMEYEEVAIYHEKQKLQLEDGKTDEYYKTYVPTLRQLLDDVYANQEIDEIYDAMMRKAMNLDLCDQWLPIQKLIDQHQIDNAMKAQIQDKLESLSIKKYETDGEQSSTFVECLLRSIFCSGPKMSDEFVLCVDVFNDLYYNPHQKARRTDAGDLSASSSSSPANVKVVLDNQEMATSATEKLSNNSKIVYEDMFTEGEQMLKNGCVSIPELISGKIIFSQEVSDQDLQTMIEKFKSLAATDFENIIKKKFPNMIDNLEQVLNAIKDLLEGKESVTGDSTSVAKTILQCTFCTGAKATDNFFFCDELYTSARIGGIHYRTAVGITMSMNTPPPEDSKETENVSKKRQHSPKETTSSSMDDDLEDMPPVKK